MKKSKLMLIISASFISFASLHAEARLVAMDSPNRVADQYIVVLKSQPSVGFSNNAQYINSVEAQITQHGAKVLDTYQYALSGMAITATKSQLQNIQQNPAVEYIESNQRFSINETQQNPDWGLDRIDQRNLPLNNKYTYDTSGQGVSVYVIDTGINAEHQDFKNRVGVGYDAVDKDNTPQDCQGHGTHVAGTVMGTVYGVAKGATVHAVRVLGCDGSGTTADIIEGIDWVIKTHQGPSVANMSLGGGISPALDQAVASGVKSGITFVVAAGNDDYDACAYSPARSDVAITVGATNQWDNRASFSNYGQCVDIFAPGVDIRSDSNTDNSGSLVLSGTSMASPHVAGVVALYLQEYPKASPKEVEAWLLQNATKDEVINPNGSPNLLLYAAKGSNPPPPPSNCEGVSQWNQRTIYWVGDLVVYRNKEYRSLRNHRGANPKNPYYGWYYWQYIKDCTTNSL
ncbi:S8 family peptidase [Cysteiniphilum halobium]|uniref:S8 family peptidase n=1 Tax=Cysteiniphilum halobium TaxID=2219059 RepID=UPI003F82A9ED